ncbi:hypothetical protein EPR50_G00193830 [Perca flavescens]|uniref:Ig-like domain-containing protein n=1 Tax=Perca flavescens TaxID=8167 RepID=A0A484C622_PERFV|nr:hypothetical protein EPR50_G00193830 [Perca flavescens]
MSGNISLKLSKVKLADRGTYRCFIPGLDRQSFVQLHVGAVSSPVISLVGLDRDKGGVVLQCESEGWYPEPEVLWLDGEGNLLSAGPPETVRGPDDLYTVSSSVTVEKRPSNRFTCRVQQKDTNQTRETEIHVPDTKISHRDDTEENRTNDLSVTAEEAEALTGEKEQQRREEAERENRTLKEELETMKKEFESKLAEVQRQLKDEKQKHEDEQQALMTERQKMKNDMQAKIKEFGLKIFNKRTLKEGQQKREEAVQILTQKQDEAEKPRSENQQEQLQKELEIKKVHESKVEVREHKDSESEKDKTGSANQSSATGPVIVHEVGRNGKYIHLRNTSREIAVTGYAKDYHPIDLTWRDLKSWTPGDKLRFTLTTKRERSN